MTAKKSTQKRDARTNRCCFANQTYCFFAVLVAVAVVVAKAPLKERGRAHFLIIYDFFNITSRMLPYALNVRYRGKQLVLFSRES